MRLLLDTQAFLWFVTDDPRLSTPARAAIEDGGNERILSVASVWEMAIKHGIGKLSFTDPFPDFVLNETASNSIRLRPILTAHAIAVASLPLHHRDPFDRLIIAQAVVEGFTVVSSDAAFDPYGTRRLW